MAIDGCQFGRAFIVSKLRRNFPILNDSSRLVVRTCCSVWKAGVAGRECSLGNVFDSMKGLSLSGDGDDVRKVCVRLLDNDFMVF